MPRTCHKLSPWPADHSYFLVYIHFAASAFTHSKLIWNWMFNINNWQSHQIEHLVWVVSWQDAGRQRYHLHQMFNRFHVLHAILQHRWTEDLIRANVTHVTLFAQTCVRSSCPMNWICNHCAEENARRTSVAEPWISTVIQFTINRIVVA